MRRPGLVTGLEILGPRDNAETAQVKPGGEPRPAPVITTIRQVRSAARTRRCSWNWAASGSVSAFSRSGRDRVSCTTPAVVLPSVSSGRSALGLRPARSSA
jgi:hypothetical protein